MLILAGVSISLVLGSNGVLTQAQHAEEAQTEAEIRDHLVMAVGGAMAEGKGTMTYALLADAIDDDEVLDVNNFDSSTGEYESDSIVYTIGLTGNISEAPNP